MFTRKHYKEIADVLHNVYVDAKEKRDIEIVNRKDDPKAWDAYSYQTGVLDAVNIVVGQLSVMLIADGNERFSPTMFRDYIYSVSKEDLGL